MARSAKAPIRTAEQLRIAASPATFEVLEALQLTGPTTVSELGPQLGRKANSLHFHVRKLLDAGFVKQVGSQRSGARTEAIYDVVAEEFSGSPAPKSKRLRRATTDAVASLLRLASRNFVRATTNPAALTHTGRYRNILAHRHKTWLTQRQLAEVNEHIEALTRIFLANHGTQRGTLYALTTVLTPLQQDGTSSDRNSRGKTP